MKSKVYFTKYLIDTLLSGKDFSDKFFYFSSKLKDKDLHPLITVKGMYTSLFLKYLYIVLSSAFNGKMTGTLCDWKEFNIGRIVEVLTVDPFPDGSTQLKNFCIPLFRFLEDEITSPIHSMLKIKKEDVIISAAKMLEDFTANGLRRNGLVEGFYAINKNYYWRECRVYG